MLKLALVSLLCVTLLCAGVSAQKKKVTTTKTSKAKAKVTKAKAAGPKKCQSVVKTAESAELNLLLELVTAAGLGELLDDEDGDFTIFAPTDDAIEAALKALKVSKKDFLANKDLLAEILTYHVLPTAYTAEELAPFGEEGLPTLLGYDGSCPTSDVGFKFSKKAATVVGGQSSANVVTADVQACSTIVHVIDAVLVPCPIADAGDAKEISRKKKAASKEDGEVVEDEEEEVPVEITEDEEEDNKEKKGSKVVKATTKAKASKTEDAVEEEEEEEEEEVVTKEVTVSKPVGRCKSVLSELIPEAKTLVKAIAAAGLSKAINDKEAGITVFAPTDEAFEAALEALGLTAKELLSKKNRTLLKEILEFHVLRGSFTAADLKKGGAFTTLLGKNSSCKNSSLDIKVAKKVVTVDGGLNSATVVEADIEACTSTVHFIDTVLLPCEIDIPEEEDAE